jgi:hypothetical protein
LEAIVSLHEEQKDWERVVHFKKRLLDSADDAEKIEILHQIGTVWSDKLKQPQKAIEAYVEATRWIPTTTAFCISFWLYIKRPSSGKKRWMSSTISVRWMIDPRRSPSTRIRWASFIATS